MAAASLRCDRNGSLSAWRSRPWRRSWGPRCCFTDTCDSASRICPRSGSAGSRLGPVFVDLGRNRAGAGRSSAPAWRHRLDLRRRRRRGSHPRSLAMEGARMPDGTWSRTKRSRYAEPHSACIHAFVHSCIRPFTAATRPRSAPTPIGADSDRRPAVCRRNINESHRHQIVR